MTAQTALHHNETACISPLDKPQHIMIIHLNEIEQPELWGGDRYRCQFQSGTSKHPGVQYNGVIETI